MKRSEGLSFWRMLRALARTLADLRPGAKTLRHFFVSLLLCGIDLGLGPMPAGLGLLAACDSRYIAACVLGVLTGGGLFWGLSASLELYAMTAALLCVRSLLLKRQQTLLVPCICIGLCALIGLLFAAGAHFSRPALLRWLCGTAAAAAAVFLFRAAQDKKHYNARAGAFCAVLLGLNSVRMTGGWNAAATALAWAISGADGLRYACAGSAALAIASPQTASWAAAFCFAAAVQRMLKLRSAELDCAASCIAYCLAGIRLGSYGFSACAMAGCILALLLPPERLLPIPSRPRLTGHPAQRELRQAERALEQAAEMLDVPDTDRQREIAALFDEAGAQVCRNCAKYKACWPENGQPLLAELAPGAQAAMARGRAVIEDLPPRFQSRCLHADALLTAINDALDDQRARRQRSARLREVRAAAQTQYLLMGRLMARLSDRLYAPDMAVNYEPELCVRAAGRGGSTISGDRGAAFSGPNATYYVLLCDGMGTGPAAAAESLRAVSLLRQLLLSGMDAESALKALNGIYILRDNGCFSTVDLLRINLTSGDAILYKWGAAPSYLKRSRGLRLLGGANPPPGLDRAAAIEQIHLSLEFGGVLVLASDGLGGKQTQKRLELCSSLLPQDVAASLFAGRTELSDDCTAVAIRLRPAAVRERVPI